MVKFIQDGAMTPDCVCQCCEGLFFKESVYAVKALELKKWSEYNISNYNSVWICGTCRTHANQNRVPILSTKNGFQFPEIPDVLKDLSPLEERMVSPIINFMQIRPLMPHSLNPQLSLKGSIVNISVQVTDMVKALPRKPNEMQTIQLKFKRHVDHSTDYMFETIRPWKVCMALEYLSKQELYKENGISVDPDYYCENERRSEKIVPFVVEQSAENKKIDVKAVEKDKEASRIAVEEFFNCADDDEEILLIDQNLDLAQEAIYSIAPGQGKTPLPWLKYKNIDELCFPKIFAGQSFNLKNLSYTNQAKSELRRVDRRSCIPTRVLYMAKKTGVRMYVEFVHLFTKSERPKRYANGTKFIGSRIR